MTEKRILSSLIQQMILEFNTFSPQWDGNSGHGYGRIGKPNGAGMSMQQNGIFPYKTTEEGEFEPAAEGSGPGEVDPDGEIPDEIVKGYIPDDPFGMRRARIDRSSFTKTRGLGEAIVWHNWSQTADTAEARRYFETSSDAEQIVNKLLSLSEFDLEAHWAAATTQVRRGKKLYIASVYLQFPGSVSSLPALNIFDFVDNPAKNFVWLDLSRNEQITFKKILKATSIEDLGDFGATFINTVLIRLAENVRLREAINYGSQIPSTNASNTNQLSTRMPRKSGSKQGWFSPPPPQPSDLEPHAWHLEDIMEPDERALWKAGEEQRETTGGEVESVTNDRFVENITFDRNLYYDQKQICKAAGLFPALEKLAHMLDFEGDIIVSEFSSTWDYISLSICFVIAKRPKIVCNANININGNFQVISAWFDDNKTYQVKFEDVMKANALEDLGSDGAKLFNAYIQGLGLAEHRKKLKESKIELRCSTYDDKNTIKRIYENADLETIIQKLLALLDYTGDVIVRGQLSISKECVFNVFIKNNSGVMRIFIDTSVNFDEELEPVEEPMLFVGGAGLTISNSLLPNEFLDADDLEEVGLNGAAGARIFSSFIKFLSRTE